MVNARDRMLAVPTESSGPICDDCVWKPADMKYRQQANSRGRELQGLGLIRRGQGTCSVCGSVKTVSVPTGAELPISLQAEAEPSRPWHWEGSVQSVLVAHLLTEGWTLLGSANTATKEAGVDVRATDPDGAEWWISAKGYPERKPGKTTSPSTQARHWFSRVMFDVVRYRSQRHDIRLGVCLPDGWTTYRNLTPAASWLQTAAPFTYFWAGEDGSVRTEP